MAPFEKLWSGNDLTTSWNRPGSQPQSFQADFEIDWDNVGPDWKQGTLKEKKGSIYNGQTFTIRNGHFNLNDNSVKFDMIFDESHPAEEFEGVLENDGTLDDVTSIKGTVKVKASWLQGKPPNV
ncbi:hypothetical protein CVT26_011946 [Gymnopilus dilepis]|uniref:Uncharacterized protein n=1 Tax=Gymnopilus dilepis TaxID=231916 RepID=A0A409VYG2_9AGAR|nr:hypothetical protein CVT26_011946 [Gymnopilus dilepis]